MTIEDTRHYARATAERLSKQALPRDAVSWIVTETVEEPGGFLRRATSRIVEKRVVALEGWRLWSQTTGIEEYSAARHCERRTDIELWLRADGELAGVFFQRESWSDVPGARTECTVTCPATDAQVALPDLKWSLMHPDGAAAGGWTRRVRTSTGTPSNPGQAALNSLAALGTA